MARPRNLKNYKPPVEMISTKRQPYDPTPKEIRERIAEIQATWSESIRAARAAKVTGVRESDGASRWGQGRAVPTVSVRDMEAAAE